MASSIQLERVYPHPPAAVWRALTDPMVLAAWLMPNDFAPVVGHRFTFRTTPRPGFDGVVRCEVLVVDEPHHLVYSWQGGPMRQPTEVRWSLTAVPKGTRLRLEHYGFVGASGLAVRFVLGLGWRGLLRRELAAQIARSTS